MLKKLVSGAKSGAAQLKTQDDWREEVDPDGNTYYVDPKGEMYRLDDDKKGHKRIDTMEKISMATRASEQADDVLPDAAEPWNCPACTFENDGRVTHCDMCQTPRDAGGLADDYDPHNDLLPADNETSPGPETDDGSMLATATADDDNELLLLNGTDTQTDDPSGDANLLATGDDKEAQLTEEPVMVEKDETQGQGQDDQADDDADADDGPFDINNYSKEQQEAMHNFESFTGVKPEDAVQVLKKADWSVSIAVDRYFHQHPENKSLIEEQFNIQEILGGDQKRPSIENILPTDLPVTQGDDDDTQGDDPDDIYDDDDDDDNIPADPLLDATGVDSDVQSQKILAKLHSRANTEDQISIAKELSMVGYEDDPTGGDDSTDDKVGDDFEMVENTKDLGHKKRDSQEIDADGVNSVDRGAQPSVGGVRDLFGGNDLPQDVGPLERGGAHRRMGTEQEIALAMQLSQLQQVFDAEKSSYDTRIGELEQEIKELREQLELERARGSGDDNSELLRTQQTEIQQYRRINNHASQFLTELRESVEQGRATLVDGHIDRVDYLLAALSEEDELLDGGHVTAGGPADLAMGGVSDIFQENDYNQQSHLDRHEATADDKQALSAAEKARQALAKSDDKDPSKARGPADTSEEKANQLTPEQLEAQKQEQRAKIRVEVATELRSEIRAEVTQTIWEEARKELRVTLKEEVIKDIETNLRDEFQRKLDAQTSNSNAASQTHEAEIQDLQARFDREKQEMNERIDALEQSKVALVKSTAMQIDSMRMIIKDHYNQLVSLSQRKNRRG